ncbi:MAG: DUF2232 domain-containing protein, partial [Deltaproteobacteria bacterium]|nr:DUF2232 domain-containing protein [Deltaproteobacteria bacterium]
SLPPEKVIGYPAAALLGMGLAVLIMSGLFNSQSPWAYGRSVIKSQVEESFQIYQEVLNAAQRGGAPLKKDQEPVSSGLNDNMETREGETQPPSAPLDDYIKQLTRLFIVIFPGLTVIGTILVTWINFMAGRLFLARSETLPSHLADLKKWKAPETLVWVVIAFGICVVLPFDTVRNIGINGLLVLSLIYFFAGLSVVSYYFDRKAVPRFFRILTYFFIALQQYLGLVVVGLGLFDLWFDFRKLKKAQSGP